MKTFLTYVVIGAVVGFGVWFYRSGGDLMMSEPVATPYADSEMIIDTPIPGDTIISPLSISGEARGPWFFEADFPVELKDSGGSVIATGIATAQSEWTTTDFVPFIATITFPPQASGSVGTLVFHKDNPSGLPANADSRIISLTF